MKLYNIIFINSMVTGTLIAISSISWFSMWMGLEINLLSIIPLFLSKKTLLTSESAIKYFIAQALASALLLMAVIMMFLMNEFITPQMNPFTLMLNTALLMKLGAAPFHFWFPEVMEGLSWVNCLILLTWQKIAPSILIMNTSMIKPLMISVIIISLIISVIMAFNQISMRKIMTFSSINHIAWMLTAMMFSLSLWLIYFTIYSFMTLVVTSMLNTTNTFFMNQMLNWMNSNKINKLMFCLNFFSLGGLPPFIGFLPKWMLISYLNLSNNYFLAWSLILFTLIMLFVYSRIMFSSILILHTFPKIKINKINLNSVTWMNILMVFMMINATMLFNLT